MKIYKESVIYQTLSQYQKDGYHAALQIADTWNGALVCDGVGSGKTYIGLMLLERYLRENKRVLLITPKLVAESVWNSQVSRQLQSKYGRLLREHYDIKLHTDLGRRGGISDDDLAYFREHKDVIIIDEAHHFRNPSSNRGRLLMELAQNKKLYLLTATPINNSLDDIYHLINYFGQNQRTHFAKIGVHDFRRHFRSIERRLEDETTEIAEQVEEDDFLRQDPLLKQVLIQRSRKYIKDAEMKSGTHILFPERVIKPTVEYSLRRVYRTLYDELQEAFDRNYPFLNLAIYNTVRYHNNPERQIENRQKQIIGLIRTLVLKRLESSWRAFEATIENLLLKMAEWLGKYAPERFGMWEGTNTRWWGLFGNGRSREDVVPVQKLITTDVLAEGLNLQDASIIVNYDLHWNPVRLMQRIGRLDRRLDPAIEEQLNRTNPTVHVWNFLPPAELDDILKLRKRVDGKILRISRTLGIEGKFVSPDDDDETVRLFNERYDGTESIEELMNLARQRISESNPKLWRHANASLFW